MQPQQIRNMLTQTLDDFRLSRGEKSALNQILDHIEPTEHDLSVYRAMAFDLAREAVEKTDRGTMIEWLESVIKLLEQHSGSDQRAVRAESHFSPSDDCPRRIQQLLSRAKISIEICVFTITDDRLASAILDAHRRKVKVQIISDDDKSHDLGSDIQRLSQSGISVRTDDAPQRGDR